MGFCYKKLCVVGLMTICCIRAFELVCPHLSHRWFHAKRLCQNTSMSKYACLLDIYIERYIESCDKDADFVLPGEQYVISGARLSSSCPSNSNRYQPFLFWSNVQSQCYYQKSLCNEAGQFIYSQNSTKDDSTCRCDYTQGYGFVNEPNNPCYCTPSQEDCSCYKVQCPTNTVLSADYKCISSQSKAYKDICKALFLRKDNSSRREPSIHFAEDSKTDLSKQSIWIWATCIVIIGICMLTGCYIFVKRFEAITTEFCGIVLNNEEFCNRLRSKFTKVKEKMEPSNILDYLRKNNVIDQAKYDQLKQNRRDFQCLFILLHFLESRSDNVAIDFQKMCRHTNSNLMKHLTTPFTPKRWPRRDFESCAKQIRCLRTHLKKEIKLADFIDVCFEKFICSLDEYKCIVQRENDIPKQEVDELLIRKLESLLDKGSFECLLEFVQIKPKLWAVLKTDLPPAIFINLNSKSSLSPETKVSRDQRIKLQMEIAHCENHVQLVSQDRIKYCAKWLIELFAMYPDYTTVTDKYNALEFVPLIDDGQYKLIKSTNEDALVRVMEIYFCGKDVVRNLHNDMEIQISLLAMNSDNHQGNVRGNLDNHDYDMAMFLSEQRPFLLEELQPSILKNSFPDKYQDHFKHIDCKYSERVKSVEEILDIVNTQNLSEILLDIFFKSDKFFSIKERFNNLRNAYLNSAHVAANIIDDFVNLAAGKFDLKEIGDTLIEKNVLIDGSFPNFESGTSVDGEEHLMIEFLVKIVLAGRQAIGTFVYALYKHGEDKLADSLSRVNRFADRLSNVNEFAEYSGNDKIENSNSKDVLLQASFKISFVKDTVKL